MEFKILYSILFFKNLISPLILGRWDCGVIDKEGKFARDSKRINYSYISKKCIRKKDEKKKVFKLHLTLKFNIEVLDI